MGDVLGDLVANYPIPTIAGVAALAWQVSVFLNPYAPCWKCRGIARYFGWIFTRTWHSCSRCNGSGSRVRAGGSYSPRVSPADRARRRRT